MEGSEAVGITSSSPRACLHCGLQQQGHRTCLPSICPGEPAEPACNFHHGYQQGHHGHLLLGNTMYYIPPFLLGERSSLTGLTVQFTLPDIFLMMLPFPLHSAVPIPCISPATGLKATLWCAGQSLPCCPFSSGAIIIFYYSLHYCPSFTVQSEEQSEQQNISTGKQQSSHQTSSCLLSPIL